MPVLPIRTSSGRLVFTLCAACAEEHATTECCIHSEKERALKHQIYCTPELFKALDKGYKILEIDEVWHWEQKDDQLFREFQLRCFKAKVESSGFPKNCITVKQKQAYVDRQNAQYSFGLEVSKVTKNAGRRTLAKQNLVQFWGRWGMKMNKMQTRIVSDMEELLKLYGNINIEIGEVVDITDKKLLVSYCHKTELAPIHGNLSLVIALFTTCWARLHLYEQALEKLDPSQILYYDTDSVFWIEKDGFPTLPLGDNVGQFKDETEDAYGVGHYISKFFCRGPKSYGYQVCNQNGSVVNEKCLAKGILLNCRSAETFNPETMLRAVVALDNRKIMVRNPRKICRDKNTSTLYNREEIKKWTVIYTKRVLLDDDDDNKYCTLPFGYQDCAII